MSDDFQAKYDRYATTFGDAWEQTMRLANLIADGTAELRRIVNAATPGPWRDARGTVYPIDSDLGPIVAEFSWGVEVDPDDAAFITTFDPVMVSALLDLAESAVHERAHSDDGNERAQGGR